MRFSEIFSTSKRQKLLQHLLLEQAPDAQVGVEETARKLSLSKGLVSKYFDILAQEGILKKYNKFYIDKNNYRVHTLRKLVSIALIDLAGMLKDPEFLDVVEGVGVYGSWARGENVAGSEAADLEIWIRVSRNPGEGVVSDLASILSKKIPAHCGVSTIILPPHKVRVMRQKNPEFYSRLKYESVILWGKSL